MCLFAASWRIPQLFQRRFEAGERLVRGRQSDSCHREKPQEAGHIVLQRHTLAGMEALVIGSLGHGTYETIRLESPVAVAVATSQCADWRQFLSSPPVPRLVLSPLSMVYLSQQRSDPRSVTSFIPPPPPPSAVYDCILCTLSVLFAIPVLFVLPVLCSFWTLYTLCILTILTLNSLSTFSLSPSRS